MFNLPQKINQLVFTPFCCLCRRHADTDMQSSSHTCIGETAAAGAVLTGIPLKGLLGGLWTETFCPAPPARDGNIYVSKFKIANNSSWFVTFLAIKNVCHAVHKVLCLSTLFSFAPVDECWTGEWEGSNELSGAGLRPRTREDPMAIRKILA